jgi:asparaginyl-tRNA synthetase
MTRGFQWLLPVILSKSTDPLWPDPNASIEKRVEIEIYGEHVRPTLSMIVHKIVACSLIQPKIFTLSPNIRIERRERAISGIHAYEFTQLDFEDKNATSKSIRRMVEEMMCGLIRSLNEDKMDELCYFRGRRYMRVPKIPFAVYDREMLENKYGSDWNTEILYYMDDPIWITNLPREFYDFEDMNSGKWDNYDLILPKLGEVLSGSRREVEYTKLVSKMRRDNIQKKNYRGLLKLAREGRLSPSAGAGIGVERLVSWITKAKHVGEVQFFPKIPGIVYEL